MVKTVARGNSEGSKSTIPAHSQRSVQSLLHTEVGTLPIAVIAVATGTMWVHNYQVSNLETYRSSADDSGELRKLICEILWQLFQVHKKGILITL